MSTKLNLPNNPTTTSNLTAENTKMNLLYNTYPRSVMGNLSYTSTTSGIVYDTTTYGGGAYTNQGEQGLLLILQDALKNYLATANDFNYKPDYSDPVLTSFKNKIINGDFSIWQRGTSQTSSGYGSDDRWKNINVGTTKTHSRQEFTLGQTSVPNNPKYYSRTVVASTAGAGNYCLKLQALEGVSTFSGTNATVSFYAKADTSKNIAIEFNQYFGTGGSPSSIITGIGVTTIALQNYWVKHTVTISIPSILGKTLGTDGNDCLNFIIWLDAGSSFNSRTNSLGQQSGTFEFSQFQIESGSIATNFEQRPIGIELELCQRYYWKMNSLTDAYTLFALGGHGTGTTTAIFGFKHPVQMRVQPIVVYYLNTNKLVVYASGSQYVITSIADYTRNSTYSTIQATVTSGLTSNLLYGLQASNDTTVYIAFDAEL